MATVGIITEYNPFHNGHKRQIERIRASFDEDVTVVALMSGNFVQRGDLAVLPKGYRALAALQCGVDLVLELPYPYSGACAEVFGFAGVYLLHALGVEYLAFGSESGSLDSLATVAENVASPSFEKALADSVAKNPRKAFATLRDETYRMLYGAVPPRKPNDILGVSYLSALSKLGSDVTPLVIKREGRETATASRKAIAEGDEQTLAALLPEESFSILKEAKAVSIKRWESALLATLRLASPEAFASIADLPTDLAVRLIATAKKAETLDQFWEEAATKTYTNARIRRGVLSSFFGVTREMLSVPPAFTRLLGANEKGRAFLSKASFPILTRNGQYRAFDEEAQKQVLFADRADSVYALADDNPRLTRPFILQQK